MIAGIIRNGQIFTGILMSPNLPKDHKKATICNSIGLAKLKDEASFAAKCKAANLQAICGYQEEGFRKLTEQFEASVPTMYHKAPLQNLIYLGTPIHATIPGSGCGLPLVPPICVTG